MVDPFFRVTYLFIFVLFPHLVWASYPSLFYKKRTVILYNKIFAKNTLQMIDIFFRFYYNKFV